MLPEGPGQGAEAAGAVPLGPAQPLCPQEPRGTTPHVAIPEGPGKALVLIWAQGACGHTRLWPLHHAFISGLQSPPVGETSWGCEIRFPFWKLCVLLSHDVFRETESREAGMDQLKLVSKSSSSPYLSQIAL